MAKGKLMSTGKGTPVKGGNTKMFGKQHAGPRSPGVTGKAQSGSGGKYFQKGGNTKMFGKGHAIVAKPGVVTK